MSNMPQMTPTPPFLFLDAYPFDFDDPRTAALEDPPWEKILAVPSVRGIILKTTDGTQYGFTSWFTRNFIALTHLVAEARGTTILLGGYHYTQFTVDPAAQAETYVRALEAVGYTTLDIVPIVDVEGGGERSSNRRASAAQVVDSVSAVVKRIKELTGRRVMLYGRGLMRDLGIFDRMGCDLVWNPSYTRTMSLNGLSSVNGTKGPWALGDVALWQYEGDGVGDTSLTRLPTSLAGYAKGDLSVFVDGADAPTWPRCLARLR